MVRSSPTPTFCGGDEECVQGRDDNQKEDPELPQHVVGYHAFWCCGGHCMIRLHCRCCFHLESLHVRSKRTHQNERQELPNQFGHYSRLVILIILQHADFYNGIVEGSARVVRLGSRSDACLSLSTGFSSVSPTRYDSTMWTRRLPPIQAKLESDESPRFQKEKTEAKASRNAVGIRQRLFCIRDGTFWSRTPATHSNPLVSSSVRYLWTAVSVRRALSLTANKIFY